MGTIAAGITDTVWDKIIYGIGIYGPDYQPVKLNKLNKGRAKYDLRKFYFTNRVVNAWNSLPDHVVLSETINILKSRLDKFWQHQDMIYDFQAELHGTGSCSLHNNEKLEYMV